MADISNIQLMGTNGEPVTYSIKDETARNQIKNNISNFINYERIGRLVDETFNVNKSATGYFGMQGGALIDDNTIAIISNHYNSNGYADENSLIRKISLDTGNVLLEKIIQIGHGNGFCYDKTTKKFYIACAHGNVNNDSFSKKLIILDEDFNIENTINTDINYDSVCIDEKGNLFAGVTYKGDTSNAMKIYKLNKKNFDIEKIIILNSPIPNNIGTGQDFCIFNNQIFFLQYNPNQIFVFDMNGNNIKNYLFNNNNFFNVGEPENINSLGNGKFIIGSSLQLPGNLYYYEQFFIIDVIKNIPIYINSNLYNNFNFRKNFLNFYVDNSIKVFAPDGSENKPFFSIEEIINSNYDITQSTTINLVDNNNYPVSRINNFNGTFVGSQATITSGDNFNSILIRSSNIYFNNIKNLCPLNLDINSKVRLYNCNIVSSSFENLIKIMSNSICELENCTFELNNELSNVLFNNVHGLLIWNKNNQSIININNNKIFSGTVLPLVPLNIFNGTISKGNSAIINNNNLINIFKQLSIRFTDQTEIIIPNKNGSYYFTTSNFSKSGSGNNIFYSGLIKVNEGTITFQELNQITFNSNGELSINTNPEYNIYNIYAY